MKPPSAAALGGAQQRTNNVEVGVTKRFRQSTSAEELSVSASASTEGYILGRAKLQAEYARSTASNEGLYEIAVKATLASVLRYEPDLIDTSSLLDMLTEEGRTVLKRGPHAFANECGEMVLATKTHAEMSANIMVTCKSSEDAQRFAVAVEKGW